MKFSYKFSNLIGSIYRNGNIIFTPDGNSVISPVGNRLAVFDLKNNKSHTLSLESRYNYTTIALSPNGSLMIAVNAVGEAQLISMVSRTVIHRHKFQNSVQFVEFSPNGAFFAVAKENFVFIFRSPGEITGDYKPFELYQHFLGGYDDVTFLDWSSDSNFLAIGCRDNSTKIIATNWFSKFRTYVLSGHTDSIVGCFFEENSMHLNTLSKNGQFCLWECSLSSSDITENRNERKVQNKKLKSSVTTNKSDNGEDNINQEPEDDIENSIEDSEYEKSKVLNDLNEIKGDEIRTHPFFYKKLSRHYLADEPHKDNKNAVVTAANYNRKTNILVVGFSNGSFYLYEIPEVNMIHSLSISAYAISTAIFNCTGDWVALASKELGQLLVWEWQSEQYIMKQQGHSSEMTCISYSHDGQYIATGGEDAKVKIWNTQNCFCFVTFNEHASSITAVQFNQNKKFLVSSSLDGTVRAFDISRYRNFRTFTSPERVQFSCVTVDNSGELVAAGCQDVFDIYLWSMKFGKLLEVISGHKGPVTSLCFSPLATSSALVSGSWDQTVKIWHCMESNSEHETIDLYSDVTCIAFSPNGAHIAVANLKGSINVFDIKTAAQISSIEGRNDLASGRSEIDVITAKKNLEGRYFTSIAYSVDGECILAGGKSQIICIYHVSESILLKKIEITQNHSYDGLNEYISHKNVTEFGNIAMVEQREERESENTTRLPGVQRGDMAMRNFKPEVRVFAVKFSPTGHTFATACTEGLCIYSLDKGVVFDPFDLSLEVTPKAAKEALASQEFSKALIMALKLNEHNLISRIIEQIPCTEVPIICSNLPSDFANHLLQAVSTLLQTSSHIEFYLHWICHLLDSHGSKDGILQHHSLLALHEGISRKYEVLGRICDFNKYTMKALIELYDRRSTLPVNNATHKSEDSDENLILMSATNELEVN